MLAIKINNNNQVVAIVYDSSTLKDLSQWILVDTILPPADNINNTTATLMWGTEGLYYNYSHYELPEETISEQTDDDYNSKVEILISKKYSLAQELALHRQRDTKTEEFAIYNAYCEECKEIARQE